jgi:hypothetical protein
MKSALTICRIAKQHWAGVCLCFFLPASVLLAQNPNSAPSDSFDLSHWSLTLPDANATVISPAQLTAGFTNSYFYTGADGAMVFWCPVTGGTTGASDFPRCELREMLNPTDNSINWSGYGTHVLNAQCRVTQIPSTKRVVIGQIHSYLGNAPPLVLLVFNDGNIEAQVKLVSTSSANVTYPLGFVGLNNPIQYRIQMVDGVVSITVNGTNATANVFQSDASWTTQTFYFKAGDYCLDNSGLSSEGAKVRFFQLSTQHGSTCVITSVTADAAQCCLTWSSQPGREYFVQGATSTSQADWLTLSPNLTAEGNTTSYCVQLPSPYHFFRVGVVVP